MCVGKRGKGDRGGERESRIRMRSHYANAPKGAMMVVGARFVFECIQPRGGGGKGRGMGEQGGARTGGGSRRWAMARSETRDGDCEKGCYGTEGSCSRSEQGEPILWSMLVAAVRRAEDTPTVDERDHNGTISTSANSQGHLRASPGLETGQKGQCRNVVKARVTRKRTVSGSWVVVFHVHFQPTSRRATCNPQHTMYTRLPHQLVSNKAGPNTRCQVSPGLHLCILNIAHVRNVSS